MSKGLNDWAAEIYDNSIKHGFYDELRTFDRACMLITGEVHEAHEEFRSGRGTNEIYYNSENPNKPEGVPIELADALIRLLDTMHDSNIDIEAVVKLKTDYNKTRPFKHGRNF